jgi:hypothetical protein
MIISKLHRFVFVAIPKTGTHSVRQALREQMGPEDMEQVKLFVDKSLPFPELAKLGHGHISLRELQPHLSADDFAGFFKFAFVRNPFDRFVSYCSFMTRTNDAFDRDPKAVMRHFLFTAPPMQHILFAPQYHFVTGADGALLADMIGRVEQMQESYDAICERIGIPTKELGKSNASKRGDYRAYYDQQLIDGVARLYARDLELFGYQF